MSPTRAGTHFSALVLTHSECRFANLDFRHLATVRDTGDAASPSIQGPAATQVQFPSTPHPFGRVWEESSEGWFPPGRESPASFSHQSLTPFCLVYWSRVAAQMPLPGLMRSLDRSVAWSPWSSVMPAFPCPGPHSYLGPGWHYTGVGHGEVVPAWLWGNLASVSPEGLHKGGGISLQMTSGQKRL